MKFNTKMLVAVSLLLASKAAFSEDWVTITPNKELQWQMNSGGVVYFRNLNDFNPSFLSCCYNYSLNVTTDSGKAMWSTILAKIAANEEIIFGVADMKKAGPITHIGKW